MCDFQVVNYEANIGKKIGSTVSNKFGLSDDEVQIYKRSLGELCSQMMRASRQGIAPAVTSAEAREQQKQKQRMGSAVSLEKVPISTPRSFSEDWKSSLLDI